MLKCKVGTGSVASQLIVGEMPLATDHLSYANRAVEVIGLYRRSMDHKQGIILV